MDANVAVDNVISRPSFFTFASHVFVPSFLFWIFFFQFLSLYTLLIVIFIYSLWRLGIWEGGFCVGCKCLVQTKFGAGFSLPILDWCQTNVKRNWACRDHTSPEPILSKQKGLHNFVTHKTQSTALHSACSVLEALLLTAGQNYIHFM